MTKRSTTRGRKSAPAAQSVRFALDPLFACLIFAGVALGTLAVEPSPRLTILWTTLLILWVAYREGAPVQFQYQFADIGRGLLIGLAVGGPLMLLAHRALRVAIPILFVSVSQALPSGVGGTTIFVSIVVLAPLAEELFFRDILQRDRGLWLAVALYAAAGLLLFVPTAGHFPWVLLAVVGAWAVLGIMYGLFYERFGLATTLACHVATNLLLFFVPALLDHLGLFTQ